ncbi:Brp/Blh family beta-carotene 15,15'-dioxygenase [Lutimonas sp.]|uniref:Brp/Blh family beta-carotene 15,15'-dioxygenase n=1 Tax=Lutimonas sp. TaxID=1872403 RepID=UPI003C75FD13
MTHSLANIKLLITFFLLWITTVISVQTEAYLAYGMILTVGILHGSNDIELLFGSFKLQKKQTFQVVSLYILMILLTVGLFYFIPGITLAIFILFSAYHFGEQHFVKKVSSVSVIKDLFFLSYGMIILSMLFVLNETEVIMIISQITGVSLTSFLFSTVLIVSVCLTLIFGIKLFIENKLKISLIREVFLLLVFYIIFKFATVLWAFAIYFIVWHAYPSIMDQISVLKNNMKTFSLKQYMKTSFIYWLISVTGIGILFLLTSETPELFNALFFTFIAAISFPHIYVIRKMNSDQGGNQTKG